MPFADETFDFTFCQAAFKNFSEPVKAIAEMYRVLKRHGTALIVDMRREATAADIECELKGMKANRLNEMVVRWTFKNMLLRSAYRIPEMEAMIAQTPFRAGRIVPGGIGFQAWLEK